jgi:hypothetical protein
MDRKQAKSCRGGPLGAEEASSQGHKAEVLRTWLYLFVLKAFFFGATRMRHFSDTHRKFGRADDCQGNKLRLRLNF